ncbi:hypothetical protein [Methylobacterium aquaticum]|jgi:hypothetical protein|uniref:Uncharacterized protein n=1 Tax=Methylobacterium aquaticum TaxID=270351 RepID=A0A0J6SKW8_9HYPH|nr:hypothetical protein [Methylobacterium aquaticum]KMO34314.1 hypothetical protein VP06_14705 [Methylobacterium aquaticum]
MAAIQRKNLAQVGAGDPKVVALPGYREIPACLFPLKTDEAKAEYDRLARMVFDAGQMTVGKHSALCAYIVQFDGVTDAALQGKPPKGSHVENLIRSLKRLDLGGLDKPIAAPAGASVNKFARVGLPNRRR